MSFFGDDFFGVELAGVELSGDDFFGGEVSCYHFPCRNFPSRCSVYDGKLARPSLCCGDLNFVCVPFHQKSRGCPCRAPDGMVFHEMNLLYHFLLS